MHVQTDARDLPPDPVTGARWFEAGVPTAEEGYDNARTAYLLKLLGQSRQRHRPYQTDIGITTLAKDVSKVLLNVTRDAPKGVVIDDYKTMIGAKNARKFNLAAKKINGEYTVVLHVAGTQLTKMPMSVHPCTNGETARQAVAVRVDPNSPSPHPPPPLHQLGRRVRWQ